MRERVLLVSGAYRSDETGATVFDDRCFVQVSGEESALISRARKAVAASGGQPPASVVIEMSETVESTYSIALWLRSLAFAHVCMWFPFAMSKVKLSIRGFTSSPLILCLAVFTCAVIDRLYDCHTTTVRNGDLEPAITGSSGPGSNSLKICCFARMHGLTTAEALTLFGSIGLSPERQNHSNVEQLLKTGLERYLVDRQALTLRLTC